MQCNIPLYLICLGPSVGLVDRAMALAGPDLWPMRDVPTQYRQTGLNQNSDDPGLPSSVAHREDTGVLTPLIPRRYENGRPRYASDTIVIE